MNESPKDKALSELKYMRKELLTFVNTTIDDLITRLENGEEVTVGLPSEIVYPLSVTPALFKGTKPTSVVFKNERISVKNWRGAYTLMLRRCDDDKHDALMALRNELSGRSRIFLSDKPDGMDVPIKINEGLFAEGDFDTEYLIIIPRRIMDAANYDYSGVSITVKQGKCSLSLEILCTI